MSDNYYLAEWLAQHLEDPDVIAAVREAVTLLEATQEPVTEDTLSDLLEDRLTASVYESVADGLTNTGIVTHEDGRPTVDRRRLTRVTRCAEVLATRTDPPENELVATVPEGEDSTDERHFGPLLLRMRELIQSAEEELFLITPFFDETIADTLVNPLDRAAREGVDITITTRYLTYGESHYNREFVTELFEHDAIRQQTTLYEYVRDPAERGGTVHAKMLLIDDSACYLGTANVTHRGLRDNLELGIILHDKAVSDLRSFVNSLRGSTLMTRVTYDDGEFDARD